MYENQIHLYVDYDQFKGLNLQTSVDINDPRLLPIEKQALQIFINQFSEEQKHFIGTWANDKFFYNLIHIIKNILYYVRAETAVEIIPKFNLPLKYSSST